MLGLGWLLGDVGHARVVQQYALVAMVPAFVVTVLGWRFAWAMAFPLAFLFLAVPVGEALIPPLMNFTADFTVAALQLSGIPVYREGTFFTIPSGNWSVVEGCSGLRYLMSSVMGGCLFAYLTYTSILRRLAFIVASMIVPVFANGVRAYLIVMIAHLSDMRLALGIDHLIYGWVFFGIVMLLLFWVGSLWHEPESRTQTHVRPVSAAPSALPLPRIVLACLLAVVTAGIWPVYAAYLDSGSDSVRRAVVPQLGEGQGWVVESKPLTTWQPQYHGADTTVFRTYRKQGRTVGVWLFYYARQRPGAELVTTTNVIVRQKHPVWENVGEGHRLLRISADTLKAHTTRLRSPNERLLVLDWYSIGGHRLTDPYLAKLLFAGRKLVGKPDDGVAVILAAPYEDRPEEAEQTLMEFVQDLLPSIEESIRAAWRV
jgi:exosortase A